MLARWPGRSYDSRTLNESPSEKEGKLIHELSHGAKPCPSMKVPPKRKGNDSLLYTFSHAIIPQ